MPFALLRNPAIRRVSLNVAALGIERLARLLVVLLVTAGIGRHLGVEQFGLYSAVFGLCTLFAVSSDLGVGRVVVRDLVTNPGHGGTLMGTALGLRLGAVILFGGFACIVATLLYGSRSTQAVFLAVLFSTGYVLRGSDAVDLGFQAVTKGQYPALARGAALLLGAAANLWLLRCGASMVAFAAVFAVEGLLVAFGMACVWRRWGPKDFKLWRFDTSTARRFLSESWPTLVALLCSQIYLRTDLLLLEQLGDKKDAGIYAASGRILEIIIGVVPLISVSVFPSLTKWYQDDPQLFFRRYAQVTRWITWGAALGLFILFVLRSWIVRSIYGEEFESAGRVLQWHLLSALVMYNCILRISYLTLVKRQIIVLWANLMGAVVNVGLNLLFIPRFGAEGAAITGVATQLVAYHGANMLFRETRWLLPVSLSPITYILSWTVGKRW